MDSVYVGKLTPLMQCCKDGRVSTVIKKRFKSFSVFFSVADSLEREREKKKKKS